MWKEGTEVCFKSCLNSHMYAVVSEGKEAQPWQAMGFCDIPWVIFGDFNEIVHPDEKLGSLDRDARQMEGFRECLSDCGLVDLGFVG